MQTKFVSTAVVGLLVLAGLSRAQPAGPVRNGLPRPATQPATGPGGADYHHAKIVSKLYGQGPQAYWIFEPAAPKPASAPVIVFNHGWSAMRPGIYGAWIDHLVQRGNIVIYPLYQDSLRTPVADFTPNAIAAVKDALHRLATEAGHVKPDTDHLAFVGHSMGGVVSANMAALAAQNGLPQPRAVMAVEPGKTWGLPPVATVHLEDLSTVPAQTLLLAVAGDSDTLAAEVDAKRIFRETTKIPAENKNYVRLISDAHGSPALKATHYAPCAPSVRYAALEAGAPGAPGRDAEGAATTAPGGAAPAAGLMEAANARGMGVDALDFFGTWKLFDGLTDAAFFGKNRNYALGNTPEQRFMGRWSDGVAIKELEVQTKP